MTYLNTPSPCNMPHRPQLGPPPKQYVVDADPFLIEYLDTHMLELELNRWVDGGDSG